ncbi:MAG: hypothetical protein A3I75_01910 [Deltaproteobacteria bacterium RIFCSPLOWO2_02_FULL_50_16]|nr:MAG: hypothetical protein A2053_03760 [Deltaproteobacteria bacterium GWA2_50_8]OGQ25690.1 MAG: hypothetical protein A3B79_07075 [Deltaproteobacteria bacterium RIFCSPHIGHO2_02_FULL_50_15]OGQ56953.1 MAG: hypothetical protein A3I75_01910 [Deltaproteobacteria bacterium RIFCSPLOWO2_02_FULL_50_16]OGQ68031.1 MAG: hypothetical protein A3F89_05605 [Deltaproteobacteria bacterium RIFCSPLOWO2_12_FULL_50_11]
MEGSPSQGSGLSPNIASLLCYICMPITSIIFMLVEKENKDVQFHAWQATAFGVGYIIVVVALEIFSVLLGAIVGFLGVIIGLFVPIVGILAFITWIICMVKAYQGERWKIPYVGDFAANKAGLQ